MLFVSQPEMGHSNLKNVRAYCILNIFMIMDGVCFTILLTVAFFISCMITRVPLLRLSLIEILTKRIQEAEVQTS